MINKWISGILGLAVVAVPFLTLSDRALTWTLVIVGLAISASNFWSIVAEPADSRKARAAGSRV